MFRSIILLLIILSLIFILPSVVSHAAGMKYLVKGKAGPSSLSDEDTAQLLENVVLPSLDQLAKWEKEGKVVGGLPVGKRALVFILEASSNDEVDKMLRSLPIWMGMKWKVIPLQSFSGREGMERNILSEIMKK